MKNLNLNIISEEEMTEEQKRAYKFAFKCYERGSFSTLEIIQFLEEKNILKQEEQI